MSPRRFIASFFLLVLLMAAAVAGFNAIVDPYLLFDMPRQAGFNAVKPAVENHEWEMKAYQAPRLQARTIVLGSSRSDLGFDPAHAPWPRVLEPIYNLSLTGSGLDDSLKYVRHMISANGQRLPTQMLIVGLDFESFLHRQSPVNRQAEAAPPSENDERLATLADGKPNPARTLRRWQDVATGLLSLDAIADSLDTIVANRLGGSQPDLEANGHLSEGRFRQWGEADGFATLFRQKNLQAVQQMMQPHQQLGSAGDPDGMNSVRRMLDFAGAHGMRLLLVVQPAHASRLDLLSAMGYWDDYEHWKRALTACVAQARVRGQDVALWDFGGYEFYATESVPAANDRHTRMKWYWDPVHYSSALGDLMVSRMLDHDDTAGSGVELTPDNLESDLAQTRADLQAYRLAHPQQVQATQLLVQTRGSKS